MQESTQQNLKTGLAQKAGVFTSIDELMHDAFSDDMASNNEIALSSDTGSTLSDPKEKTKTQPDDISGTVYKNQGEGKATGQHKQKSSGRSSSKRMSTASPSRTRDQSSKGINKSKQVLRMLIA